MIEPWYFLKCQDGGGEQPSPVLCVYSGSFWRFDFPSTFVLVDCSAIDLLNPQNHQNVHVSLPSMAEYCPKNRGELLTGRKVVVSVLQ